MKQLILILLLSVSSNVLFAQSSKFNAFYAKYKQKEDAISMLLPGWLIRFGINVSEEKEEIDDYRPLLRGLRSMRLLVLEDNTCSPEEVKGLLKDAKKRAFQDVIAVREGSSTVNILIKEKKLRKKTIIKKVMVLVKEEDELVLVTFNGRWKDALIKKVLQDSEGDFMDDLIQL